MTFIQNTHRFRYFNLTFAGWLKFNLFNWCLISRKHSDQWCARLDLKPLVRHIPPYYKTWSKISLGLKLMLSLLFTKGMTVTASVLNQDNFRPRFIIRDNVWLFQSSYTSIYLLLIRTMRQLPAFWTLNDRNLIGTGAGKSDELLGETLAYRPWARHSRNLRLHATAQPRYSIGAGAPATPRPHGTRRSKAVWTPRHISWWIHQRSLQVSVKLRHV
jgi:hypothetical protein